MRVRVDYPDATVDYDYDAAYNRTRETSVEKATGTTVSDKTYVVNSRNQVTSITDSVNAANDTSYDYDANGNQTQKTQNGHILTFDYDVRDRLIRVSQDATTLGAFRYDHAGMRIQKEGAQGIVKYTYDDTSVLLQTDDAGATLAKYDYGPDRLLSLEQASEGSQFYHFDALGSVVNLSKPDGSLQARYQYDAWGNERATTGASWNRFAFTGHEKDEETGLYYFKARFYDPQLGRFLSQDSYLGEGNTPPSLHRYLYAYANPTVYVDLNGYCSGLSSFPGCYFGDAANLGVNPFSLEGAQAIGQYSLGQLQGYGEAGIDFVTDTVDSVKAAAQTQVDNLASGAYLLSGGQIGQAGYERNVERIKGIGNVASTVSGLVSDSMSTNAYLLSGGLVGEEGYSRTMARGSGIVDAVGAWNDTTNQAIRSGNYMTAGRRVGKVEGNVGIAVAGLFTGGEADAAMLANMGRRTYSLGKAGNEARIVAEAADNTVSLRSVSVARTVSGPDTTPISMNSSNLGMSVEKATPELIERVSQKRQVVFAKEGSEDLAYLDFLGAEANVGGEAYTHILLRENPGKAAVLEEYLHGTQSRLGIIDKLGTGGLGSAETHVKDFMIRHQKMLGLGNEDIKILQQLRDAGL